MVGWEVSRHPEWEQMYAAGITVREISDLVHHPRNTVDLHLHVREQYIPGLRAIHEAARAGRVPRWPTPQWRGRASDLKYFALEYGRGPALDGPAPEPDLHKWLMRQQEQHRREGLHPAKVVLLTVALPGWLSAV